MIEGSQKKVSGVAGAVVRAKKRLEQQAKGIQCLVIFTFNTSDGAYLGD
jgi:hypothetical protein